MYIVPIGKQCNFEIYLYIRVVYPCGSECLRRSRIPGRSLQNESWWMWSGIKHHAELHFRRYKLFGYLCNIIKLRQRNLPQFILDNTFYC